MFNARIKNCDLTRPPVTWEDRGQPVAAVFCLLLAVGVLALAIYCGYEMHRQFQFEPAFLFGVPIPMVLLWVLIRAGLRLIEKRFLRIEDRTVLARSIRLSKRSQWREPFAAYQGVVYRTITRSTGSGNSRHSYAVFQILLWHSDQARTILLYESLREAGMRAKWEQTALAYGRPALEQEADGALSERSLDDLDKSVGELLDEGKLTLDPEQVHQRVPESFTIVERENYFEITVRRKRVKVLPVLLMLAFAGAFVGFGFFGDLPAAFGWGGVFFMVLTIVVVILNLVTTPRAIVTDNRLELVEDHPFGRFVIGTFPLDKLETIKRGRRANAYADGLIFRSDEASAGFAEGCSEAEHEWLRQRLLVEIAKFR